MTTQQSHRTHWTQLLLRLARPVLAAASQGQLKQKMPLQQHPDSHDRAKFMHLEAIGRLLAGIAPWLEGVGHDAEEEPDREKLASQARQAIANAVNPAADDFMNFTEGHQPLVDAAFLAHSFLRAPNELWQSLDRQTQQNVIDCLRETRIFKPGKNNWLLFSAIIEGFFASIDEEWREQPVEYAFQQHLQWYKGDGVYGDGPDFHWDYYNSYVIQSMLLELLNTPKLEMRVILKNAEAIAKRAIRYAEVQERMISPEGTYPPLGRSLAYRTGAFQLLAHIALLGKLPQSISPEQVRCALTAIMDNCFEAPGTFDENGWLRIGLCGDQPEIGEVYISTGSLYLCSTVLLPLGLPPENQFWSAPDAAWTAKKAWSGSKINIERSIPD